MPSLNNAQNKNLSRRKFLGLIGGTALGAIIFEACGVPEQEYIVQSPVNMPEDYVKGEDNWYATTSDTSDHGESIIVRVMQGRAKKVEGNPDFPNTLGKHRAVTETELQSFYHPDRIAGPLYRKTRSGNHRPISWKEALTILDEGINSKDKKTIITKPLRGLNRSVVEKFASETNSSHLTLHSLGDRALRESTKSVFGTSTLPYFDIKNSDLIISFGLDFLGTWGPVEYENQFGKFRSKDHRGYFVQIEPRMSLTAASADQWIYSDPGKEGLIALLIAKEIINNPETDPKNIEKFNKLAGISKIEDMNNSNVSLDSESVANATGINKKKLDSLLNKVKTQKHILFLSGGTSSGYSNAKSLNSLVFGLNYLTGAVNNKGGVKINPEDIFTKFDTGNFNLNFSSASTSNSQIDWNEEQKNWDSGNQSLVIIRSVDFLNEMPGKSDLTESLGNVKLSVGFGTILNDTLERCDLILPDTTSMQSWGVDVPEPRTGYHSIAFQQPVASDPISRDGIRKLSDSRNFFDTLMYLVSDKLGDITYEDLCKLFANEIFKNDISKGSSINASSSEDFFKGVLARGGWWNVNQKLTKPKNPKIEVTNAVSNVIKGSGEFHFIPFKSHVFGDGNSLSTPWAQASPDPLTSITWDSWLEINTKTAEKMNIKQGDIIKVSSDNGEVELPAYLHPAVPFDVVAAPIGLGKQFSGRYSENRGVNIINLIGKSKLTDNGDISWSTTRVRLNKTNTKKKISKFEGTVPAVAVEPGVPILTVGPNESAEEGFHRAHEEHLDHTFGDHFNDDH